MTMGGVGHHHCTLFSKRVVANNTLKWSFVYSDVPFDFSLILHSANQEMHNMRSLCESTGGEL